MPNLIEPEDMPEEVRRALQLLGLSGRAHVLHVVAAASTPLATAAIAQEAGIAYRSTVLYLQHLEDAGLVLADRAANSRHGHQVHWSARHGHIAHVLTQVTSYLIGERPGEPSQVESMLHGQVDRPNA